MSSGGGGGNNNGDMVLVPDNRVRDEYAQCATSCSQRLYQRAQKAALPPAHKRSLLEAGIATGASAGGGGGGKRGSSGDGGGGAGLPPGRVQLGTLLRLLDCFGMQRSSGQKQMHRGMAASCAPRIFRHDTDAECREAMLEFNLVETKPQYMVVCPRRFGKTIAVSMFVTAYIMAIPECVVSVFSTGRRASKALLDEVKRLLAKLPHGADCIRSSNVETLHVEVDGNLRRVSSYPSAAKT